MSIGYACIAIGVRDTNQKTCILKNASSTKLLALIEHNLNALENVIEYNIENRIKLYRISSDIIPFASSPVNTLEWWHIFDTKLSEIGDKIISSGMRVSMHAGPYTVINSPNEEVVTKSIEDLRYHNRMLDCLGLPSNHKIVLHVGGVYNDKKSAIDRFVVNYNRLDQSIKERLVIENDDRSYNICDVLEINKFTDVPIVYDNLHNKINPCKEEKSDIYWIKACEKTWKKRDGCQKIHYSQQDQGKKTGAHSHTIRIDEFMMIYNQVFREDLDIMLEVKDKNLSAVKCINCTTMDYKIKMLELEWRKYKYAVLESSHIDYNNIRSLLKNKEEYPAVQFYSIIERALQEEIDVGSAINAAQHVWGYFKKVATVKEKLAFIRYIEYYNKGTKSINLVKNFLLKMTIKYKEAYLMDSYYFINIPR